MDLFKFKEGKHPKSPILISVPHSGTFVPAELMPHYLPEQLESLEDTDWFVNKLYDFATDLGISIICANYHRYVIDLNRDPSSKPLYDDGRTVTELCPTSTFNEEPLYYDHHMPTGKEITRRIETYYNPYHNRIQLELDTLKDEFGVALLWDAHSIKQYVPGIRKEVFPDLILGDNKGKSAPKGIINTVLAELEDSRYKVAHNDPFKGGYITRNFGKPENSQFALQLEMTKINYMGNDEMHYHGERADHMRSLLKNLFEVLIEKLPHERL